jgi:osmotically-inducible protein OsmY
VRRIVKPSLLKLRDGISIFGCTNINWEEIGMSKKQLASLLVATLASLLVAACGETNVNNRANQNANANRASAANANNSGGISVSNEDLEKWKEEAKRVGSKIGEESKDAAIWGQIRLKYLADGDLRTGSVNVDVENNVVTLRGTVASEAIKTKAEQIAQSVSGVQRVNNNLQTTAGANTNAR